MVLPPETTSSFSEDIKEPMDLLGRVMGGWSNRVGKTTGNPIASGPSPCLIASLSASSSPSLSQLGSVVLGLGKSS